MGFFSGPPINNRQVPGPFPPRPSQLPPRGSQLDTIPAIDPLAMLCIRQWLDEWFLTLVHPHNPTLIRLLTTYGEALDSNGLRASLAAVQKGIDSTSPGQRAWRWLSLGAATANSLGDLSTPLKILHFMLQFDSFVRSAIEADDVDGFIEIGIDPPSLHSKSLIAAQAMTAAAQIPGAFIQLPQGNLSVDVMRSHAAVILDGAARHLPPVMGPQFLIGRPLADGEWADSKSGEFRYGRRIQT